MCTSSGCSSDPGTISSVGARCAELPALTGFRIVQLMGLLGLGVRVSMAFALAGTLAACSFGCSRSTGATDATGGQRLKAGEGVPADQQSVGKRASTASPAEVSTSATGMERKAIQSESLKKALVGFDVRSVNIVTSSAAAAATIEKRLLASAAPTNHREIVFIADRSSRQPLLGALRHTLAALRFQWPEGHFAGVSTGHNMTRYETHVLSPLAPSVYPLQRALRRERITFDGATVDATILGLSEASSLTWHGTPEVVLFIDDRETSPFASRLPAVAADAQHMLDAWAQTTHAQIHLLLCHLDQSPEDVIDGRRFQPPGREQFSLRLLAGEMENSKHVALESPAALQSALGKELSAPDQQKVDTILLIDTGDLGGEAISALQSQISIIEDYLSSPVHRIALADVRTEKMIVPLRAPRTALRKGLTELTPGPPGLDARDFGAVLRLADLKSIAPEAEVRLIWLTGMPARNSFDDALDQLDAVHARVAILEIRPELFH
jgi:hypothetical protein